MHETFVFLSIVIGSVILVIHTLFNVNESFLSYGGTDNNLLYVPEDKKVSYPKEKRQLEMLKLLSSSPIEDSLVNSKILFQEPQRDSNLSCPIKMNVIDSTYTTKVCNKNCSSPQDISPGLQFDRNSSLAKSAKPTCQNNDFMISSALPENVCTTRNRVSTTRTVALDSDSKKSFTGKQIFPSSPLPSPTTRVENYYSPFLLR